MSKVDGETTPAGGDRGDFPFPLTEGPKESRYLTWLRNHSNYMATAGFMDYLRIAGVLIRGIILNFLISLSVLLVISLVVAHLYRRQLRSLDFDPAKVRDMLAMMALEKRPVDQWLSSQLSFDPEYKNVLKDYGHDLKNLERIDASRIYATGDLRDPVSFVETLKNAAKSNEPAESNQHAEDPGHFVLKRLSQPTRDALEQWQRSRTVTGAFQESLVNDLNAIIRGAPIWDEPWVERLNMPAKTKAAYDDTVYVENNPRSGRELPDKAGAAHLNRGILEAAYPEALGWARPLVDARRQLAGKSLVNAEAKLAADLSTLIKTRWIYNHDVFADVRLCPKTQDLLNTLANTDQQSGSDLRRLNWLLLEDVYPELPKNSAASDSDGLLGPILAWVKSPLMPYPFVLTGIVVAASLLLIMCYPLFVVFGQIAGAKRCQERAGGDSSVKRRDLVERFFGGLLLLILTMAAFEALPVLEDRFHQFRADPKMNANAIFALLSAVAVSAMGRADTVLRLLGGAKQKVAMWLLGLLGLVVPLLVILYVVEFLIYGHNIGGIYMAAVCLAPLLLAILALLAILVGVYHRSFKVPETMKLLGLAAGLIVLGIYIVFHFGVTVSPDSDTGIWNFGFVSICAVELWIFCRLVVDVNLTSVHRLYRDRLASAYLMGLDSKGDVGIEEDILLEEICYHEAGSAAPYHLINVALNLQGSKDMNIRDRESDFFIFSKKFIGGNRTGYCRTTTMEQVHTSMSLATAMAISAAAASPNMGRSTNPATVALMVLLNIRLGYWLPNPGLLEEALAGESFQGIKDEKASEAAGGAPGFGFAEVFEQELIEIQKRWDRVYRDPAQRAQRRLSNSNGNLTTVPTTEHGLVGIAFSGGGIRSATINLGIAQALHAHGIFDHVDYMSTVSGGGYLGASISTLMRARAFSDIAGEVTVTEDPATREQIVRVQGSQGKPREYRYSRFAKLDDGIRNGGKVQAGQRLVGRFESVFRSEIDGKVSVQSDRGGQLVIVEEEGPPRQSREYRFAKFDALAVKSGDLVRKDQALIERFNSLWDRFRWRVRPSALLREMLMKLDETHKWVNLSDGGHIENLAVIELLRRRCKFIIIGDGEADPELAFNGLATLIRYARIDLGITIDLNPDQIRLNRQPQSVEETISSARTEHWAFGTITYPPDDETGSPREEGHLIYLKSSFTGDEDEMIKEYRHSHPEFPHESTADQFFHENQFECYRALGQHIAEGAIAEMALFGAIADARETAPKRMHKSASKTFEAFSNQLSAMASAITGEADSDRRKATQKKMDRWNEAMAPAKDNASPRTEETKIKKR